MKPHITHQQRKGKIIKSFFFLLNTTHTNQRASLTSRGLSGIACTSGQTVLYGPCSSRLMIILQFELHKHTIGTRDINRTLKITVFSTQMHTRKGQTVLLQNAFTSSAGDPSPLEDFFLQQQHFRQVQQERTMLKIPMPIPMADGSSAPAETMSHWEENV